MSSDKVPEPSEVSIGDENKYNYHRIENMLKFLTGRILTIVDASFSEGKQNKAIKDLIREDVSKEISRQQKYYLKNDRHSVKLPE